MRLFLAALTLGAIVALAAATSFASDNVDPTYYTDRMSTGSSVSAGGGSMPQALYLEQRQDNSEH